MNPPVPVQLPHEINEAIPYSPMIWEHWWFWVIIGGLVLAGVIYFIVKNKGKAQEVIPEEKPLTLSEKIENLIQELEKIQLGFEPKQWKQAYALHSLYLRSALELFTDIHFTDMTVKEISQKMDSVTFLTHGEKVDIMGVLKNCEAVLYADKQVDEELFNKERQGSISIIKSLLSRKLALEAKQQEATP